jgi:glucose 1-dehydrogenase
MRVLITGAASGIGRATCLKLARDAAGSGTKARIAAVDLEVDQRLEGLASELVDIGAEVLPLAADMATVDGPSEAVAAAVAQFGGLDGLVSNAGVNGPGSMLTYTVTDWDRLFAVNTRAAWLLAKSAHEALAESNGAIVIVASMSGSNPHANLGAYGPSKAAVIMLAKVLAQEFGPAGIRVNTLSPGMVKTGMTEMVYENQTIADARGELVPLGRVAQAEEMADVVAFMLSEQSRYMSGHDLVVDGALTGNLLGRLPGLSEITKG